MGPATAPVRTKREAGRGAILTGKAMVCEGSLDLLRLFAKFSD